MEDLSKISCNNSLGAQISYLEVDESAEGQRIDNFLLKICKGVPKSHIYRILRSGEVRVNKKRISADYRLNLHDIVRIPPIRLSATKEKVKHIPEAHFDILYEDQVMIALNKPSGIAVHGGSGISFGVIEQIRQMRPKEKFLELVHRLDKETSGILLLAKKRSALVKLHEMIRQHQLDKRYYACVYGEWPTQWKNRRVVQAPLRKLTTESGERRVIIDENGLPSHTIFHLVKVWKEYALIEAELKTGRTHQIRVHLASLNLPIVGDEKYGNFELNKMLMKKKQQPILKRMFLHAFQLTFQHPVSGEMLRLEAPLPKACADFLVALDKLANEKTI